MEWGVSCHTLLLSCVPLVLALSQIILLLVCPAFLGSKCQISPHMDSVSFMPRPVVVSSFPYGVFWAKYL